MSDKTSRQAAVLRLVRQGAAANQAEIVRRLRQGRIPATQASISRDLRELGLVKVDGRYRAVAELTVGPAGAPPDRLAELVTGFMPVGANLIVVRTPAGQASAVAVEIDRRNSPDIAGTIAGDDTIFVAVGSRSAQGRVVALLRGLGVGL